MTDQRNTMTIGGEAVDSPTTFDVINPATGERAGSAPDCTPAQLDQAVGAASAAFPAWRDTSQADRAAKLTAAATILEAHADGLAQLLTGEQGKPLHEARREIVGSAAWLRGFAGLTIPVEINEDSAERTSETHHVPIGVVAGLSPWNFPVLLSFWKIAPCLRAGNTLILKPSPFTPLTMLRIGELLRDVFPAGVLNIISGGDALGPMLTSHPGIQKISFTGSTETGKKVMATAARDLKRVTLELGGNDAAIVLPDADVDTTARELFWAAFRNSGQICIAAKRIYVHDSIYDRFATAFVAQARAAVMGDGAHEGTQLGPVQNRTQFQRVRSLIDECKADGLQFLTGAEDPPASSGYFIPVTIIDNPPDDARVVREEPFGPIVPLLRYAEIDEAVRRANATDYGLAGSVWSTDERQAREVAAKLDTGTVWINEYQYLTPFQPFAGHKQSGLGSENGLSGLLEYTVPKTITTRHSAVA